MAVVGDAAGRYGGGVVRRSAVVLPVLASVSGASGIAYELLYVRVLTLALGDTWYTVLAVMLALFGGMAAGAWLGRHRAGWLPVIEASLGLHALAIAAWVAASGAALPAWLPATAVAHPLTVTAVSLVLVGPAALLIGAAVPLFGVWRARLADARPAAAFGAAYLGYNAGAAASLLAVAFVAVPALGIATTLGLLACLNLAGGTALALIQRREGDRLRAYSGASSAPIPIAATWGLLVTSMAAAWVQVIGLRVLYALFGPHPVVYAVLLFAALTGVALGTALATLMRVSWSAWILGTWTVVAATWLLADPVTWAVAMIDAPWDGVLVTAWLMVALTATGGLVASWLNSYAGARSDGVEGRVLALSALGNAGGFGAYIVLLSGSVADSIVIACVLALLVCVAVVGVRRYRIAVAALGVAASAVVVSAWPATALRWGTDVLQSVEDRQRYAESAETHTSERWGRWASVIEYDVDMEPGTRTLRDLSIQGYNLPAIAANEAAVTNQFVRAESLFGALPALWTDANDEALVIGVGTGITAGAAAQVYDDVTVVDNNPAMAAVPHHFDHVNWEYPSRSDVETLWADGLTLLRHHEDAYDSIIVSANSPLATGSERMYTREAFEAAARALGPNGTFFTWIDYRMPAATAGGLYATIEEVFTSCRAVTLTADYIGVICGEHVDEPVSAETLWQWPEAVRARFPNPVWIAGLIYDEPPVTPPWDGQRPEHTLNRPTLPVNGVFREVSGEQWRVSWSDALEAPVSPIDVPGAAPVGGTMRCPALTAVAMGWKPEGCRP